MNQKFICIHGHFYQPPRENAWLEEIEIQESASPYHDWNERITQECYGPNGVSRILNDDQKIVDIVNNYAKISFNFGPTLLSWLEAKHPLVYQSILDADKMSLVQFNGHGSAMAQVYNHIIMPLASKRDKETQVKWGIFDFEKRFMRKPEGMWLAEAAVDVETLEVLAENKIKFTVLAPQQAAQYRKMGSEEWTVGADTRLPYRAFLPSGKTIDVFFYDGQRSQDVAFGGILNDGKKFANNLLDGFDEHADFPQLVNIATDGETYGHHHKNGDMALAYCLSYIEENNLARITNYSEYLSICPPSHEIEIVENSSWSCAHGIERWRSNCGCNTGGLAHWNQEWRVGLRKGLDWLRDEFAKVYEKEMKRYDTDIWRLRNEYIKVLFNRSPNKIGWFIDTHFDQELTAGEITHIIRMLEMQKQSMYMFTSCGWFFNDISGIETIQILQYANRGIQLVSDETNIELEDQFRKILATSTSNILEFGSACDIYDKHVATKRLSLTQVGMHYAVSSVFSDDPSIVNILNYDCTPEVFERYRAGIQTLAFGTTRVKSRVTLSEKRFSYVILYLGNHHLLGSTSDTLFEQPFQELTEKLKAAFESSNLSLVIDMIRENFSKTSFSFFDLFKDEQIKLLQEVIDSNVAMAMYSYDKINDRVYSLINVMHSGNLQIPQIFKKNLETVVLQKMENLFANNTMLVSIKTLKAQITEISKWEIKVPSSKFEFLASRKIATLIHNLNTNDDPKKVLDNIYNTLSKLSIINIHPQINELQDAVFQLITNNNLEPQLKQSALKLAEFINFDIEALKQIHNITA